jgi:hypothetical protein
VHESVLALGKPLHVEFLTRLDAVPEPELGGDHDLPFAGDGCLHVGKMPSYFWSVIGFPAAAGTCNIRNPLNRVRWSESFAA